jgi:SnoaL-like domain
VLATPVIWRAMWDASPMPWVPELFSAPVLERLEEKWERERLEAVPYYDGLMAGEHEALIRSFAGEPVLHDPLHGRVLGAGPFDAYIADLSAWLAGLNLSFDPVDDVITETRQLEEVVLHLDGQAGRVSVPVAIVADRRSDGRLVELRVYHSMWPVIGDHVHRRPLLQRDPELRQSDVVADYQRALAAGDVDAVLAAFEADGYAREPAGGDYVHRGSDGLRAFYEHLFSNDGGIPLEHCSVADDGRACVLEYTVVRWGKTELPPEAGVAVYVRGERGKLAAARIYDDADPSLGLGEQATPSAGAR